MISLDHKKSDNSVISAEDYEYDDADNLVEKTVDSVVTTCGYDYIDQLLSESRTGYSVSYTYDANCNRASKTMGSTTETYTNDTGDKLTEIKVGSTTIKSFVYDTAGRRKEMTDSGGTTYYLTFAPSGVSRSGWSKTASPFSSTAASSIP